MDKSVANNPLAYEKPGKLIIKYAVPSIISMLVGATYNIVDQIFVGQGVGLLGNAATNVAFPFSTFCVATALLVGVGGASAFNLAQGAGKKDAAAKIVATAVTLLVVMGTALALVTLVFLEPLLKAFGSTAQVLPYAMTYTSITALGFPILIFSSGFANFIRSDGSPKYAMASMISGALVNTVLDPLFIFGFGWGMAGAAWATVIGQAVSGLMCVRYLFRFQHVQLTKACFKLDSAVIKRVYSLGLAAFFNQIAMAVVQIILNNTLTFYGAKSQYGAEIPLAVSGIISKVSIVFMSIIIGIAQGNQPIIGFNYGAQNYDRVKKSWKIAAVAAVTASSTGWLCFQLFPRQIISLFGKGSPEYFLFAEKYFRTYMLMFFAIGVHPITSNFFTAIGKPLKGIFISLTRQILFLLPLLIIFPRLFGIEGVMYAAPIADTAATIVALSLVFSEMKYKMNPNSTSRTD